MIDPGSPVADVVLPAFARDAHLVAAEAILRRLAAAFPSAGLGITGSLATGTHRAGSDIDLVMADESFRRDIQFATVSEGIPTAVVCLRPHFDADRERRWMLASGGEVRVVSMVRSAFVARDPNGVMGEMQRTVARLDRERLERRDELAAIRRDEGLALIRALHGGTPAGDEHLQMQLFTAIVDGWFLLHGLAMETRQASERMLDTIAAHDRPLYDLLRRATPLTHAALAPLLRAFDHVFAPVPGAG
ncbi:MAG TPA: nucleotidyltransferase domain-containing protein [Longimicrobium sp.]|nr:nucleotidyltransferase domain-containing protein [Longimicrobium sp.]